MRRMAGRSALATTLLTLTLLATTAPAIMAGPSAPTAGAPHDFIAGSASLSKAEYSKVKTETLMLPTFDGEKLYMEITRPDPAEHGEGPWPVIFEASPYHGANATRIGDRIFPDPLDSQKRALGLTGFFPARGYAVVMMDLRGTGRSTGCLDHLGPNDAKDLKLAIEWLESRSWSNGKIGMTGHSYVGSTPIVAAAMRPKGLATIVPSAGLASMYDHQFQKGVPYNLQWIGPMVAYETIALQRDLPPGSPTPPVIGAGSTGDNWQNGPNAQMGCGMQNSAAISGTGQFTGQYELWHGKRDWRDAAADADIPIWMIHGVNDNAARIPAAEWFFNRRFGHDGDKVWLGQWDHGSTNGRCGDKKNARTLHPNCRFDQWKYGLLAWFDKHLKDREVNTGPAVEVFLNGEKPVNVSAIIDPVKVAGKVITADSWRAAETKLDLYPDATDGSLKFSRPTAAGSATFGDANGGAATLVVGGAAEFVSAPLAQDTVFLGMPRMDLSASITGEMAHITVRLLREAPNGEREVMNHCAIQPQLRHGVQSISPVVPGQEMDLPMQCFTMAHWVPAGNKLVMEVGTATAHHFSFGQNLNATVYTGPDKTRYALPLKPGATLYNDVQLRETP